MEYVIILEKSKNGYGAYAPDLPGCVAVGDTVDETSKLMKEAIVFHIKGMKEDGDPIPEPTSIAQKIQVPV